LVHPRILARTVEIERAVIRSENGQIMVKPLASPPPTSNSSSIRTINTPEQVLGLIRNQDPGLADRLKLFLEHAAAYGLQLVGGTGTKTPSIHLKSRSGNGALNFGEFRANCTFRNHDIARSLIGAEYLQRLAALLPCTTVDKSSNPDQLFEWTVKKSDGNYVTIAEILSVQDQY